MTLLNRLTTPIYKNTGSVARDHLANERTYLAWLRTGLGFIALGIAVERFAQLDLAELLDRLAPPHTETQQQHGKSRSQEHLLVGALLGTGSGSIAYGTTRYFSSLRLLEKGLFKPAYGGAVMLGTAVAGLAGAVYVSAMRDHRRDKRASEV
ncbi:hypothetical protein K490DRAFT_36350 [Saccharata proteae CBS 121410]|uniref:DUF202 domain-containing protein n=1 Tax=Saccharata proteae CBS 121410 TaxID=1314787 RepID=A0A9P4LYY5_9PEZI|nr:hypothetical protein K490DRAFT_36350 [Saccharata proteae CBS 121410]